MNEFQQLLTFGLSEAINEIGSRFTIAGEPTAAGSWQENERGKSLESQAGFSDDIGGSLLINKQTIIKPGKLSGATVTREDGLKFKITSVRETPIIFHCTLQPLSR